MNKSDKEHNNKTNALIQSTQSQIIPSLKNTQNHSNPNRISFIDKIGPMAALHKYYRHTHTHTLSHCSFKYCHVYLSCELLSKFRCDLVTKCLYYRKSSWLFQVVVFCLLVNSMCFGDSNFPTPCLVWIPSAFSCMVLELVLFWFVRTDVMYCSLNNYKINGE